MHSQVDKIKAKISSLKAYNIFYENFLQEGVRKIIRDLIVIVSSLDQSFRNSRIMIQVLKLTATWLDIWVDPGSTLVLQQNPIHHWPF
jgi:hypothetical protein